MLLARASSSTSSNAPPPILIPGHLAVGAAGLLFFLAGVTAAAGIVTRSASQALVVGVLAGVVAAGVGTLFFIDDRLNSWFPVGLAAVGLLGFAWCFVQYGRMES
jgi:hypothetical protein